MPLSELLAPDGTRLLTAIAVAAGYVGLCGNAVLGHRQRRRAATPAATVESGAILVVHASQTGFAETVARQTAAMLVAAGRAAHPVAIGELDQDRLAAAGRVLFVLSTTGEGDAPDPAAGFARRLLPQPANLDHLRYGLLALGDRSYRQFCAFGRAVDQWLAASGAVALFPMIEVDDGDAAALEQWRVALAALGADAAGGPAGWGEERPFQPWRLVERRCLNPDSPDHPAFHLSFAPVEGSCEWVAGDLVRVEIGQPSAGGKPARRDYSIASIPEDGRLDLLVRLARHADGGLGLGSGWLTQELAVGGTASLQVRSNAGFHAPAGDRPLVLIGNGTGLAGLRAHLKARAARGQGGNWLLFGERRRQADYFHQGEIEAWRQSGILARLDLAFSRDQVERIHVQHRLRAAAADLTRWMADDASILVCGSAEGMAPGVHAVLADVLGESALDHLAETGRYRRDVY
ncbi:sulfite reductase (NADPH) flavoprotein alpha-component [Stella humosa]|uniref:NADPH--hemoprotein reductase n=1 Tax=Stella humosa TaxID=94 RepID=A0A3N1L944_9PROT|nr:sulfite reductase subunit alpha [Stella humosa]ROP91213.1 sulfite reductase (NADPH) flavoprotein alpha-component [Stella humosa]BBK34434.1 oxidoreductase [Stella humosa]